MSTKLAIFFWLFLCLVLIVPPAEAARGGGGRGGRGGGGGGRVASGGGGRPAANYRGGNSINRTPSMSRAARTVPRNVQQRPNIPRQNLQKNFTINPSTRNQLNQFVHRQRQTTPARTQNLQNLQNVARARQGQGKLRNLNYGNLQHNIARNNPGSRDWFRGNFFEQHNFNLPYAGTGLNLWSARNWTNVQSWLGGGWGVPIYYQSYYDDAYSQPDYYSTQDVYSTQPLEIPVAPDTTAYNEQPPDAPLPEGDWLPLGVFALGKDESVLENPSMFLQLALNKNGDIVGTYYNALTNQTYQVSGLADPQTQIAAIQLSANPASSLILQTGVYNLTLNQTQATLFFPDGSQQTWWLVRVQEPSQ